MLGPVGMLAHAVSEDIAARADKLRIFTAIFPRLIIDEALGQLEATPASTSWHSPTPSAAIGSGGLVSRFINLAPVGKIGRAI